jgi:predicted Zn-ribbon and HTH transcriptional regulator
VDKQQITTTGNVMDELWTPLVYQAQCSSCGYASSQHPEAYFAVVVDQWRHPTHGHPEAPCVASLEYPVNTKLLTELGFTFRSAMLSGRILLVKNAICRKCGVMREIRFVYASMRAFGRGVCLTIHFAAILVAYVVFKWFVEWWGILLAIFCYVLIDVVPSVVLHRFVRKRYKYRVWEFHENAGCSSCKSHDYTPFRTRMLALPCPKCHKRSVQVITITTA